MLTTLERKLIAEEVADAILGNTLMSMDDVIKLTGKTVRSIKDMCRREKNPLRYMSRGGVWLFKQKDIVAFFSAEKS